MRRAALVVLWCIVAAVIVGEARTLKLEFAASLPWTNLKRLRKRPRPKIANHYREQILDDSLAEWKLDGPLYVALPPMYSDTEMGNAGFLSAFVNNGDVLLYNEPYPQPRLTIDEHMEGAPPDIAYHFDNRATNAALFTRIGGSMWPLGYTTWYDVVFAMTYADATTPRLIASDGTVVEPTAVRAIHPLNKVDIFGDVTRMEMRHLSPIVWTFPREGRLQRPLPGYVVESVADGAEVSYMPTLPLPHGHPFGMMLLAPRAAPTTTPAPRWWPVDERFRRAVVDAHPVEERRALLKELAHEFPMHPFLDHYRVIAELGSDRFDAVWLDQQREQCVLPTWYLVAWTKLGWSEVRTLPCIRDLGSSRLDERGEYIASAVVLAFRALRDDPLLEKLAERVVDRSYLNRDFRGFNYPPSNFAWLWLKARR